MKFLNGESGELIDTDTVIKDMKNIHTDLLRFKRLLIENNLIQNDSIVTIYTFIVNNLNCTIYEIEKELQNNLNKVIESIQMTM